MAKLTRPTHVTHGSVLDDLGFSPEKAAILKLKAAMHQELLGKAKQFTPGELAAILKEPQPRVSEFMNGKVSGVSIEKLALYALRLGAKPAITLRGIRSRKVRPRRAAPARPAAA